MTISGAYRSTPGGISVSYRWNVSLVSFDSRVRVCGYYRPIYRPILDTIYQTSYIDGYYQPIYQPIFYPIYLYYRPLYQLILDTIHRYIDRYQNDTIDRY